MVRYTGLPETLKLQVYDRDGRRCRWCGSTNSGPYDVHHIAYRRGSSYDVIENLILLCRRHHNYVHDSYQIPKQTAQKILLLCLESPGKTGAQLLRWEENEKTVEERPRRFFGVSDSDGRP